MNNSSLLQPYIFGHKGPVEPYNGNESVMYDPISTYDYLIWTVSSMYSCSNSIMSIYTLLNLDNSGSYIRL